MQVINLFGAPGCGKSTTAAGLFYHMKLQGLNVELVTEYAKELVYDGTLGVMMDRQEVIFTEQNQRLHRLRGKVDYAVIDSPLLLSYVYPDLNREQRGVDMWPALDAFKQFVLEVVATYDNLNILLTRQAAYDTNGRNHSEAESVYIGQKIVDTLIDHTAHFIPLTANSGVVKEIMNVINYDINI